MANINLVYPNELAMHTTNTSTTWTVQGATDYMAVLRHAEEDATITSVSGYSDLITGTPGTIRIGIQSVSSSGIPSGTWLGYGDFTADTTNFPNATSFKKTLSSNATITRGMMYAIVAAAQSGTWDVSNNQRFTSAAGAAVGESARASSYTYGIINAVTQSKSSTALTLNLACSSSTVQYALAGTSASIASWSTASAIDERGVLFNLPASTFTSYKVAGIRFVCGPTNSAATWDMVLYDSGGTVLQSASFTNTGIYNITTVLLREFYFTNSTLTALTPGSDYRLVIKATHASLGCMVYNEFTGPSDIGALVGGTYSLTTRADAGSWTNTNTKTMPMKLILRDVTSTAGGAIIPVGMSGGIRG